MVSKIFEPTFLLFSQSPNHMPLEVAKAPIHKPVIASSIPSQREMPSPAPTAKVQMGQTACVGTGNKIDKEKMLPSAIIS